MTKKTLDMIIKAFGKHTPEPAPPPKLPDTPSKITLPFVKRAYAPLIANKIVSVQPLLGPTGLVHYLRSRYGSKADEPVAKKPSKYRSIDEPMEISEEVV